MTGSNNFIPFNGLSKQYIDLKEELFESYHNVLSTGQVLNGPYTIQFEEAIAKRCNRRHAIAVNSCSSAIHYIFDYLAYRHDLFLKNAMRIAIPNYSFKATRSAIVKYGKPILLDVDKHTGILKPQAIANNAMKLDVLMYVNLFGNMIDYEELSTVMNLFSNNGESIIIEDAAQSFGGSRHGIPSGGFGNFSVLSFDPTKNLPNYGSGGMILTDDDDAAVWLHQYVRNIPTNLSSATNSRMSEIDTAGMLVKLNHFDKWQIKRKEIADYYDANLSSKYNKPHQFIKDDTVHAWHKYVIQSNNRDRIKAELSAAGIETKIHYKYTLGSGLGALHNANTSISLPIYPEMTANDVMRVVEVINKIN